MDPQETRELAAEVSKALNVFAALLANPGR